MVQKNTPRSIEVGSVGEQGVRSVLQRHPLISYFLVAYAISWGISFPLVIFLHTTTASLWLDVLDASGPTLAAFILLAAMKGQRGIGELLRRYGRWRVGIIWYVIAIMLAPVLVIFITLAQGGGAAILKGLQLFPVVFILGFFVGGPFLEEPGWRGFALPRMQQHLGPLRGSLLLGFLWGVWHLPLFLMPGYDGSAVGIVGVSTALFAFILMTTFITPVFAWISNNTRSSLLLVMLLHSSINAAVFLIPTGNRVLGNLLPVYIACAVVSLIIIIVTRGQLSYDQYLRSANKALVSSAIRSSETESSGTLLANEIPNGKTMIDERLPYNGQAEKPGMGSQFAPK
jgi:uncharacterized protein